MSLLSIAVLEKNKNNNNKRSITSLEQCFNVERVSSTEDPVTYEYLKPIDADNNGLLLHDP